MNTDDDIRRSYEAQDKLDEFKKNTVGELRLTDEHNHIQFIVKVFWWGGMLLVGGMTDHKRITTLCETHAQIYGAELIKEDNVSKCDFCGVGNGYIFKRRT